MASKCPLSCGLCTVGSPAPITGSMTSAVATFSMSGVSGTMTFSQAISTSPTTVTLKLSGLASLAGDFHVHVQPIQPASGTPCGSAETGGHYNPLNVAAGQCSVSAPQLCEVGDLSGKSGSLVGLDVADRVWYDSNLPLSGPYSIVGRSVVIHKANGERWVCANIIDPRLPTPVPTSPAPSLECKDQDVQCATWRDSQGTCICRSCVLKPL